MSGRYWAYFLLAWVLSGAAAWAGDPCPEERARAQAARARIEQEWPLRGQDAVTALVREFGLRLAQEAGIAGASPWRFAVVRDHASNAFSIGDGWIFITEGALSAAATEAQLAATLAHEMGHDLAGHFCRREDPARPLAETGALASTGSHFGSLRQAMDLTREREAEQIAARVLYRAGYPPTAPLPGGSRPDPGRIAAGVPGPLARIQALLAAGN